MKLNGKKDKNLLKNEDKYNKENLKNIDRKFTEYNFKMMYDLGKIGAMIQKIYIENENRLIYHATLPFNFKIKDKNGNLYTHHTAAVEAKEIIREYRKLISDHVHDIVAETLLKDDEFGFSYNLRDDTWDEERRDKFLILLEDESEYYMSIYDQLKM